MTTAIDIPGYEGHGALVAAGSTIRITNVEGCQIADLFAHPANAPADYLCTGRTRLANSRVFPNVDEPFLTNTYDPILTLTADTSPGIHDTLYEACDKELHEFLTGTSDHPNCRDNYLTAATELGLTPTHVPCPVNVFQNTPMRSDGTLDALPSTARADDYIELRAETDLYLIVTACSVDQGAPINGGTSTPLLLTIAPLRGG